MNPTSPWKILWIDADTQQISWCKKALAEIPYIQLQSLPIQEVLPHSSRLLQDSFDLIIIDALFSLPHQGLELLLQLHVKIPLTPVMILMDEGKKTGEFSGTETGKPNRMDSFVKLVVQQSWLGREMKQYMQTLQNSERQFRTIINSITYGILILKPNGVICFANPSAENMLCCPKDQLLGKPFDFPLAALGKGKIHIIMQEQAERLLEITPVSVDWEGDKAYLFLLRDITVENAGSRQWLNKSLNEAKSNQQEQNRQESSRNLDEFVGNIIHDFNNALSPVLGLTGLLLHFPKNLDNKDKAIHYLQIINMATQDAANIIRRLCAFYRPEGQPNIPLHVLVVDGDPQICKLVTTYLASEGYTTEMAGSGAEGLQKLQKNHFDLVVTGQSLLQMNGVELPTAIKQISSHIPVVLLTGVKQIIDAVSAEPLCVDFILSKPDVWNALHQILTVRKEML